MERLEGRFEIREGGLDAGPERLRELAVGVAAIVADATVPVDAALLDAAGSDLRVVANFAVGYDNVDLDECRRRGVAVTNTPDVLTNATAELALALSFAAARRMSEAEADLRAGRWKGWDPGAYLGAELTGAVVLVVGLGRIGLRFAELIRGIAGELLYVARSGKPDAERLLGLERVSLARGLGRADVVSLHAPATPSTRHLIGVAELEAMKASAILVNTSRGPLVDADALADALERDGIAAAGLDVYEEEPQVPRRLLEAPRCVLLPHIGSATTHSRDGMARVVADNVIAALEGRSLLTPVA